MMEGALEWLTAYMGTEGMGKGMSNVDNFANIRGDPTLLETKSLDP